MRREALVRGDAGPGRGAHPVAGSGGELLEKFRLLLASPMAEGVARIVEESFRLLPIIPPPAPGEASGYARRRTTSSPCAGAAAARGVTT